MHIWIIEGRQNINIWTEDQVQIHMKKLVNNEQKITEEKIQMTSKVKVKSLSRVQLFATAWTVAYQAPLSMGLSRQ